MKAKYDGYTFQIRESVTRSKVSFTNRYGIKLVGDLYLPKGFTGKLPAIAVSGPFGAVKEQCSGLYAEEMASRGFAALAFDPSFIGESGGEARNVASPDINTEDFSAAVDFLINQDFIDPEKIGIIGICGFSGFAVSAAIADPRIKATFAMTMYDMTRVSAKGYFDSADSAEERNKLRKSLSGQRTLDYRHGVPARAGGVVDPLPEDAPDFVKDYYAYYKTDRGYAERSLNSNAGWNVTSSISLMNDKLLSYADEIENAVILIHGEKAHSRYMSEGVFPLLKGKNKHLIIVPRASHTDLYDQKDKIPFNQIEELLDKYLGIEK